MMKKKEFSSTSYFRHHHHHLYENEGERPVHLSSSVDVSRTLSFFSQNSNSSFPVKIRRIFFSLVRYIFMWWYFIFIHFFVSVRVINLRKKNVKHVLNYRKVINIKFWTRKCVGDYEEWQAILLTFSREFKLFLIQ
jgi:hypothetical protein